MSDELYKIEVYNTISKQIEEIEVTEEIYNAYRRTQWNIESSDSKHKAHIILYSDLKYPEGGSIDDFIEFASDNIEEKVITKDRERYLLSNAMSVLNKCATQTQKRRFLLHYYKGFSTRQIGALEGVSHRAVACSLDQASEKIKKYFEKF